MERRAKVILQKIVLKSRLRETPTLPACADSSTNTMKSCLFDTFLHFCDQSQGMGGANLPPKGPQTQSVPGPGR